MKHIQELNRDTIHNMRAKSIIAYNTIPHTIWASLRLMKTLRP